MEELNPWLDPNAGKHKNKKSTKPIPVFKFIEPEKVVENQQVIVDPKNVIDKPIPEVNDDNLVPEVKKTNNPRVLEFFNTLVEDSLNTNLPPLVQQWAIENFDEKWLKEFLSDVKNLQEEMLTSTNFPSKDKLILLKLLFLMRQG
jgi:hypothetical protein